VLILFSGVEENNGKLVLLPEDSQFLVSKLHSVIHQLSQEFPEVFPHYFATNLNGFCHSKDLEDILLSITAFDVAKQEMSDKESCLTMFSETKRVVLEKIVKHHKREEIDKIIAIVPRFQKLMESRIMPIGTGTGLKSASEIL